MKLFFFYFQKMKYFCNYNRTLFDFIILIIMVLVDSTGMTSVSDLDNNIENPTKIYTFDKLKLHELDELCINRHELCLQTPEQFKNEKLSYLEFRECVNSTNTYANDLWFEGNFNWLVANFLKS
jgi:hypothetical protein